MNSLGKEHELSDEAKENLSSLMSDTPSTLLYGGGGSGKILMGAEDYEELADRLTGDEPVEGKGRALWGAEAAAYGRAMLEEAAGGPEKLEELLEELRKNTKS